MEDRIAIIGLACRVPGAANEWQFWDNLVSGTETITAFADTDADLLDAEAALLRGPNHVCRRGLLDGVELFDAGFFGYSPREAELMDPQQRLYLECAWEALENAGYDPDTYSGSIGTFAGSGINTYLLLHVLPRTKPADLAALHALAIASDKDYLCLRVAYKLNLRGPAITVQTACSTSLVAVHLAVQSLVQGECDIALAGGVSVKVPQRIGYQYHQGGVLSPDGHCRAFDAAARGTVPGNGLGIVVLKRLQDAEADGDKIRGVILGSAVSNDGAGKIGFTAPSIEGQAAVIAEAQAIAGVKSDTIGYVEAHGTGTELGDPIEVRALGLAFRGGNQAGGRCALGSVKSNIGHLEAAAGVIGLIKVVLSLEHGIVPPTLHCEHPNPNLAIETTPFRLAAKTMPWEERSRPRRAGVSSFGIGGTNAHVVVEEAPQRGSSDPAVAPYVLLLSAKTPTALERSTDELAAYLEMEKQAGIADIAYTLQVGRNARPCRRVLLCADAADAVGALRTRDPRRITDGTVDAGQTAVAFLFPGAGAPSAGFGRALCASIGIVRETFERCGKSLHANAGQDIGCLLNPPADNSDIRGQGRSDAGLTSLVLEYALAQTLIAWGIRPGVMLASGIGEYAAACLAGVVTLEEALILGALRERPDDLAAAVRTMTLRPPRVPYISSVTGNWVSDEEVTDPHYWVAQARESAQLETGLRTLTAAAAYIPVEIGPAQFMGGLPSAARVIEVLPPSDQPEDRSFETLLHAVAQLWLRGLPVHWKQVHRGDKRHRVSLPTYPFERRRFWIEPGNPVDEARQQPQRAERLTGNGDPPLHPRPDLPTAFVAPRSPLERDITAIWEEILGYTPIGVDDDFFALGGDSFLGLQLLARLRPNLPADASLQHVSGAWTVARLAAMMKGGVSHKESENGPLPMLKKMLGQSPTVLLQAGENKLPFFCIHPAGGAVLCYRQLAHLLDVSRPFYGIQAPSLYGGDEPHSIEEKAALYLKTMREIQPQGPYLVGGHSYGGNVAFEVASQLVELSEQVALVVLIDSHPPGVYREFPSQDELKRAFPAIAASYFGIELAAAQPHAPASGNPLDRLVDALRAVHPDTDASWVEHFYSVWVAHLGALHRYQPRKSYPGALTYFRARAQAPQSVFRAGVVDQERAWASLSQGALRVHEVEGDHFSIIRRPCVEGVALALRACIKAAVTDGC